MVIALLSLDLHFAMARSLKDKRMVLHGIKDRIGSDGTARGLNVAGPPEVVADYVRGFADLGIAEMIMIFRSPFDLETMSRLDEVRALLR